jgi:hypothetical protein
MNRTSRASTPEAQPAGTNEGHSLSASFFAEGERLDAQGRVMLEARGRRRRAVTRALVLLAVAAAAALWLLR